MTIDFMRGIAVLQPEYTQIGSSVAASFAKELLNSINTCLEEAPNAPIILHFAATEFIDSSGLSKILDALRLCHARNTVLAVSAHHSAVTMLFRMVRLRQLTQVFESLEQALDTLDPGRS